jgi:flagellar biosynthesis/type III secretory pathway protein FliH
MSEVINEENRVEETKEYQKGFEEGFHKGIVQGYIKGHTDATEELTQSREKSFILKIVETISKVLKEAVFINTPLQSLLNAIKSLIRAIPNLISLPQQTELKKVIAE